MTSAVRTLALAAAGAWVARAALAAAPPDVARINYRGHRVSLGAGPALGVAASLTAAAGATSERHPGVAAASLVAGLGSGAAGFYDDLAGPDEAKGFRGHLGALREGRVTSGLVKLAGVSVAALTASVLLPEPHRQEGGRRVADVLLGAGVIAGTANLLNLFDVRPGRALKVGLAVGVPLAAASPVAAGPVGAAAALLPDDLGERVMLGDSGANALGAVLGVGLAARTGRAGRAGLLLAIAALTAASERVSFTQVIDATPGLRDLDRLGRRRS